MEIPLRVLLTRLLLIIEAFSLIKGEKCWAPMLCNNIPMWKVFRECEMNEELRNREKSLEEQINKLASMITLLEEKLKTTTARTKNNVIHTSVTDVKETTKPQEFNSVETSLVPALNTPAKSPWTTRTAFFSTVNIIKTPDEPPTVRPQTTSEPSVPTILPGITEQDIVSYDGRIFIPLASEEVNKASAIAKCQQLGSKLANIYSQEHMDKIMTFIRDNKLDGQGWKNFYLGMTYDPINQILRFRNGTETSLSGFKWYFESPYNGQGYSDWTNMCLGIRVEPEVAHQYIYNYPDRNRSVLCEI
ncbi:uncharacterized protein LOC144425865 [Styela clava]